MASFNPQVGDIGHELVADFRTCDCDGKEIPLDLSPLGTIITICLKAPDQTTIKEFPGVQSSCDTLINGSAAYVTQNASDLDQAGVWCISGKVVFLDGRVFRANAVTFTVEQPICG